MGKKDHEPEQYIVRRVVEDVFDERLPFEDRVTDVLIQIDLYFTRF